MLGEDPEATLLKGAQQVYVQAQRGGYNPGATGRTKLKFGFKCLIN